EDAIAIDPPPLDVIDVVVYDEAIDGMHQLPVPDVGKEVGLHDGKLHCSLSPAPHATYARRRWKLFRPTTLQIDSTSALLSPTYSGRQSTRDETLSDIGQGRFKSARRNGSEFREGWKYRRGAIPLSTRACRTFIMPSAGGKNARATR